MSQFLDIRQISRREFLRLSSATSLSLLLSSQLSLASSATKKTDFLKNRAGGITKNGIKLCGRPSPHGHELQTLLKDTFLHGIYWLNNFNVPKSHGFVHLPPEAARWF